MNDVFEGRTIRVAFVGALHDDRVPDGFERVSPEDDADVYHIRHDRLGAVGELRAQRPGAGIVADVSTAPLLQNDRASLALLADADAVVAGSARQARVIEERSARLAGRTAVAQMPVDLDRFGTDEELAARRRVHYSRFKRYHRLAPPAILFAGPYTREGGLDRALEAVYLLREEFADLRFASILFGGTHRRFLGRCERRALLLGHRGIIEWSPPGDDELPFWFGAASVVLAAGESSQAVCLYAAASAHPVVPLDVAASEAAPLARVGATAAGLAQTVRELLGPSGVEAGKERRAELLESQDELPAQRGQIWRSAAFGAGSFSADALRVERAESTSVPSSSTVIHPR